LADLHLGWQPRHLGENCSARTRERDEFLRRAVDFAINKTNQIDAVVIAGDLFETHRPEQAVLEMTRGQLKRVEQAGVFLVTVPGNHDEITYQDSVYRQDVERWPGVLAQNPNPDVIACLEKNGEKTAFYGLAYTGGVTRTAEPLHVFPKVEAQRHIGIFHGSLDWDAGDRSLPISGEAAAQSGYDCLALGHIHRHSVRSLGTVQAVYAGAAEAKGFNDSGTGHMTVLNMGERLQVETIDAACRPCQNRVLDISRCDGPEDVSRLLMAMADQQAMVRVVLSGVAGFQPDIKRLQEVHRNLFYHLEMDSDGVFLHRELIDALAVEPTIRGYFIRRMQDCIRDAVDDEEREVHERALMRGVAALGGGVS
jgi:DNA repair exonuclease SbcCD nuclease subunit